MALCKYVVGIEGFSMTCCESDEDCWGTEEDMATCSKIVKGFKEKVGKAVAQ